MSIQVSANDILGTSMTAAGGARLHIQHARENGGDNDALAAASVDLVQALAELTYARRIHGLMNLRALDSADVEVACDTITERILDALAV